MASRKLEKELFIFNLKQFATTFPFSFPGLILHLFITLHLAVDNKASSAFIQKVISLMFACEKPVQSFV